MLSVLGASVSCEKNDNANPGANPPAGVKEAVLGGETGTRTLFADTVYIIDRFAYVTSGNTLTIQPGTILKAKTGDGATASALIIARGAKIDARGTADKPIIFTSVQDGIKPGETNSTLSAESAGLWGGLIILGAAPVSTLNGDVTGHVEGIPSQYDFAEYGGNNAADNSGILSYVSIRFTGTELAPDNEIQGLTLGGVGNATTISNIEIVSSKDDGVEIFGGTVNVANIFIAYQEDDGIDLDQNYAGTITNAMVLVYNAAAGNDGLEIDGPEGTTNTAGKFTLQNSTVINKNTAGSTTYAGTLKDGAQGEIKNCVFQGFTNGIRVNKAATVANYLTNILKVSNSEFTTVITAITADTDEAAIKTLFDADGNNIVAAPTAGKGADPSVFSWTWAKKALNLF
jgi:hypothetical protein